MRGRCLLTRLLLLLALLAGQQAVLVHAVSHLAQSAAEDSKPGVPHGKACAQCLLSSPFSSALPSSAIVLPVEVEPCLLSAELVLSCRSHTALGFRSRAPPSNL